MKAEDFEINDTEQDYSEEEALLGLFEGHYKPSPEVCFSMVNKGVAYKQQVNLYDTVRTNENFFIGKCLPI